MRFMVYFLTALLFPLSLSFAIDGAVKAVIDGDTLVVDNQKVRLLGINTPEKAHHGKKAEPGADLATQTLKNLLQQAHPKATIKLELDENKKDRYGRTLAHAYLPDGTWLNKALIQAGVAHVYSFPDNQKHITELLNAEEQARKNKVGMWQHKNWQILEASTLKPDSRIGQFRLIAGTPIAAVKVKNRIYLNYGEDWRTDFTVEIPTKYLPLFKQQNIDPTTDYAHKNLLVRGRLKPVNGVLITVTHPAQIQIL